MDTSTSGIEFSSRIVILGAIAGFVGISIHNAQLQSELDRTQRLVVEGRALSDWLLNDFTRVLESDEGLTFVRSNLADRIQNYLDSLQREVVDDDVKLSLAESLIRLAVLQGSPGSGSLGMPDQCRRYLVSAQSVLSSLRNPDSTRARILAVVIPTELADLQLSLGEPMEKNCWQKLEQISANYRQRATPRSNRTCICNCSASNFFRPLEKRILSQPAAPLKSSRRLRLTCFRAKLSRIVMPRRSTRLPCPVPLV